ncbi:peptidylprolyl isomerase [Acidobacteria bacterium AB60]|nr:peptidylprolyl isomerase [Acidobacteria bacterium AB60]
MFSRPKSRTVAASYAAALLAALSPSSVAQQAAVTLDRVVAVVNNQAILWSDITDALHVSALEPRTLNQGPPNPRAALEQIISRDLIQQQIRQEDATAAMPADKDVQARLAELRKSLPACVHMQCATDTGWKAFLESHDLTQTQVEEYLRRRLEILAFIEKRFRQGVRISQEEIETYYRDTLLPQYAKGESAPPLKDVSPRIEEILLQQQVNQLFSSWLDNLRKQGNIEVLDPALEPAQAPHDGTEQ